jgi:demethylmenaquinone methyltransferase/2-methoxy-6-polyprenyl-1,4-benzoquinol methylase
LAVPEGITANEVLRAKAVEGAPWTAEGQEKRAAVRDMFAEIAPTYDVCNALMSFSLHHRWRAYAVRLLNLQPGSRALDVCCGTGDFLQPLRKAVGQNGRIVGVDFCLPMLDIASDKKLANGLALGDACKLPVRGASVDAVTVGWGIRNVPDIDAAHQEIARVLKPGGRFVSIDMARPRNGMVGAMSEWLFQHGVPLLGRLFGKTKAYTYLPKSTQRFSTREELKGSMERAGFRDVRYKDLFFGNICIHWGQKP